MNALSNQRLEMWCIVINSLYMNLLQYMARLQEINNYIPMFSGINALKTLPNEEPNEILLHAVPHTWSKQHMMIGLDFNCDTFCYEF